MRITISLLFLSFISLNIAAAQSNKKASKPLRVKPDGTVIIDTFEKDSLGKLPGEWYNQNASVKPSDDPREASLFRYYITEEMGNKYLKYYGTDARHLNFPLRNRPNVNIYETPILSWQWRVKDLPEGGNENDEDYNDTAVSIYVAFDMGRVALFKEVPKTIRYTWSSTLEEGTELSKFFGNQKVVVVESGPEKMGEWVTFERNIVEDYKRLFGDMPPKKPLAILILSDGDSTADRVIAGYDNIMLKEEKSDE
ncbi:MAG TPA: DUF3047 domain-containing protein [Balneolaceae bacterium]